MFKEETVGLVKYGIKKVLDSFNWKNIFQKSRDNIFCMIEDDKNNIIKIIFRDENIDDISNSIDRNCGFNFSEIIKEKLEDACIQLEVDKTTGDHYINEFIKDVEANLRSVYPDVYRDIAIERAVSELKSGQEHILETLEKFTDVRSNIYSIWQYDSLLKRCNKYDIDLDFFNYDEKELDKNILYKIGQENNIYIKAPCREEGLYYVLRLLKNQVNIRDDVFVVTDLQSWNNLEGKFEGKILIAYFYDNQILPISNNTMIYILDKNINPTNKDIIEIPNRTRGNLSNMLLKYIDDHDIIHRLITNGISIFPILKRDLFEGIIEKPAWTDTDVKQFIPALLLNSWSDKEGDQSIVSSLSGKSFDDYIADLQSYTNTEDPFIISFKGTSYNEFYVADLAQAWYYVAKSIRKRDLDIFEIILAEVIPDKTSKIENGMRTVECGIYSEKLKQGLVKTLVYMNLYGDSQRFLKSSSEKFVNFILKKPNWDDIADLLPILVEASPDEFVSAVKSAFDTKEKSFLELFKSKGQEPFNYCNYPKLLSALEKGLFIEDIKFSCVSILEDLCTIKIESNIVNRPIHTLSNFFCAFFDETVLGNKIRVELLREFYKQNSENTWAVLKNILPQNRQCIYDYLSKPIYLEYEKNSKHQSTEDTIEIYKSYYKIAFLCAGNDLLKWSELYNNCIFIAYGFKEKAFYDVQKLIKDISISDKVKYVFANAVRKFIYDSRCFNRSYVKQSDTDDLEENIYNKIIYSNSNYKYLYAFESEYRPLKQEVYMEKNDVNNWKKREEIKEREQVNIFKLLRRNSFKNFLDFFTLINDDYAIGRSLAIGLDYEINEDVCKELFEIKKNNILSQYFSVIFCRNTIEFAFRQLVEKFTNYDIEFKYILLQSLALNNEFVTFLKLLPEKEQEYYWKHIHPVIKEEYEFNKYCFGKLLLNANINGAWWLIRYNKFNLEDYLQFFQALLDFTSSGSKFDGSRYDIVSIFIKIYKNPIANIKIQESVAKYEIAFSEAFCYDSRKIKPKYLYNQLAMMPETSAWIIKLSYLTDNGEKQLLTKEEIQIAEKAWHVLFNVPFCPCVDDLENYHADMIDAWLNKFLEIIRKNNQEKLGMYNLGKFFAHFPKGLYDSWLPDEICRFIDQHKLYGTEQNIELSQGFRIECYNSVGVQCINAGKENIQLIAEYMSYAKAVELKYPFMAKVFRSIAKDFEQESQDRWERAVHEY